MGEKETKYRKRVSGGKNTTQHKRLRAGSPSGLTGAFLIKPIYQNQKAHIPPSVLFLNRTIQK